RSGWMWTTAMTDLLSQSPPARLSGERHFRMPTTAIPLRHVQDPKLGGTASTPNVQPRVGSRRSLSLRSFCLPKFLEPTRSRTGQGFRHRGRAADMNSSAVCHPHVTHASDIRMVASPFEVVTTRRPGGENPRRRRRVLVVADEADIAEVI